MLTTMTLSINLELRKKLEEACGKNRSKWIREAIKEKLEKVKTEEDKDVSDS